MIDKSNVGKAASHPAWVCGLKQQLASEKSELTASHPAWVCGLKH